MSIDLSKMPKLGFGLMRLPEKDGVIDHEQVCRTAAFLFRLKPLHLLFRYQDLLQRG